MSFEKMSNIEIDNRKRSFVILYNFNNKESAMIKNICNMLGAKDQVILSSKNANSTIRNLTNNNIDYECENGINQKAMIFNNVAPMKVSAFIDSLKKFRIVKPLIAVNTEGNIDWSLNTLVSHLLKERLSMKSGETVKH